ncbi:hypothetical protein [Methanosphaera cuniculi]|uniref:hypothetical protein n=1 Tax=Methanosphaera cuniculi TaxID=1077256 RepID=UPI0026DBD6D8|nr:hypothetical protein [Methanosphaera cuniculi]
MKCPECGYDNLNDATRCNLCGAKLPKKDLTKKEPTDNRSIFQKIKDFKNSPRDTPKTAALISLVIGLFTPVFGCGQIYLGYYNRFLVEAIISAIICKILVSYTGIIKLIFQAIYLIWFIYTVYDSYICAQAKHKQHKLPKLVGLVNINK